MAKNYRVAACSSIVGLFFASVSFGHALDQGYIFLEIGDKRVDGRVEMTTRDLNAALDLALPEDGSLSLDDLKPHDEVIRNYVTQRVQLSADGVSAEQSLNDFGILDVNFAQFVQLGFSLDGLQRSPQEIDVTYRILFDREPNHRGMLVVETNWKTGTFENEANVSLIFEPGRETQILDLSSASVFSGFVAMMRLGTHHIWIGIDHILFLLALLLPAVVVRDNKRWEPVTGFRPALIHVIKVVTVFTVAHTITLSLAALNAITLSSRLVESVIAISIAIAALNIFVPVFRDKIWWVVFAFGLFHGFGFASVLSEIGIPPSYMVHSLLAFNIGVEIGQVAIVLIAFPILYFIRRGNSYTKLVLPASAAGLIVVSLYWFVERAFLIDLPAGAIVNRLLAMGT